MMERKIVVQRVSKQYTRATSHSFGQWIYSWWNDGTIDRWLQTSYIRIDGLSTMTMGPRMVVTETLSPDNAEMFWQPASTTLLQIFRAMFTSGRAYAVSHAGQQPKFFPEAVNDAATLAAAQYELSEGQRLTAMKNFADGVNYQQSEG